MNYNISQIVDVAYNIFSTVNDTIQAIDVATNHRSTVYIVGNKSGISPSDCANTNVSLINGELFSIRMLNKTAKRMIASIAVTININL
ncbi:hypothetical protein HgNV_056 [Homarus gammarus nudivirus]|uniref:Uncharacterized protein n=1 Tax=Homarus gammarus nudivirus TaxID=2509616 RepID=A0A411HB70_9VIRU|nr:hypothetical protein KM727_gp56 [Homarus gammarus nudivirus]QBB28661.1 hypothetical protein HgNV_056 [Homarus gammarus nudivirus]